MLRASLGFLLVVLGSSIITFSGYIWMIESNIGFLQLLGGLFLGLIMILQGVSYIKEYHREPLTYDASINVEPKKEIVPAFDLSKRNILVEKLKGMSQPLVIPITEFFDGNYADYGSIGCNIYPKHPGIDTFRRVFNSLLKRDDVESIYVEISEIEPGEDCWPYTDRVYVFGSISNEELKTITKQIAPTEIGDRTDIFSPISKAVRAVSNKPLHCLWWD